MTPANRVQAGSETPFPSPRWSLRKTSEGNRPRGMAGGWCQSAERGAAPAGGRERRGKVEAAARRGGARLWRPRRAAGLPPTPPGLGPQSLTCGPAPSRAPPASGTPVARRGGWANDFLLPAARPGSDSHAAGRTPEHKGKPLRAPRSKTDPARSRGAGELSRYLESFVLAPPGVRLAVLRLLWTRMDLVTQISHIYTLPGLCLLPAGSVVGITKRCALRKLLQQFYCNISILTSLNLVPAKQVYGTD